MKKIIKLLFIASTVVLVAIYGFYQFIKSDLNPKFDNERIQRIIEEVQSSPKLPERFYALYNAMYRVANAENYVLDNIKGEYKAKCPCGDVFFVLSPEPVQGNRTVNLLLRNKFVFAMKIEKEVEQNECLNYLVRNVDFLYSNKGIENAAEYYFEKSLEALEDREMITLILMLDNPSLYNPERYPEMVNRKVDKVLKRVSKKQNEST